MLKRKLSPLQVVVAIALVLAIAGFVAWRLTYGKVPEPMKRIPMRSATAPGMTDNDVSATVRAPRKVQPPAAHPGGP